MSSKDMPKKLPTISLVIPVYNEESHLRACLEAAMAQHIPFYEIIVIDNNSSDATRAIAEQFTDVTIVSETRQGVVHARNTGFNAAKGSLIARIDADTQLLSNWTSTLLTIFEDSDLDAVSGAVEYHDLPWRRFLARLDLYFRRQIARGMADEVFLFGANMALRRTAWQRVKKHTCNSGGMHEDFDLSIHLQDVGCNVRFDDRLLAEVSLRRLNTGLSTYWSYLMMSPRTYAMHGRTSQRHMYPVVGLVLTNYWLIRLVFRCYDSDTGKMSLRNALFAETSLRVNPTTYVD